MWTFLWNKSMFNFTSVSKHCSPRGAWRGPDRFAKENSEKRLSFKMITGLQPTPTPSYLVYPYSLLPEFVFPLFYHWASALTPDPVVLVEFPFNFLAPVLSWIMTFKYLYPSWTSGLILFGNGAFEDIKSRKDEVILNEGRPYSSDWYPCKKREI